MAQREDKFDSPSSLIEKLRKACGHEERTKIREKFYKLEAKAVPILIKATQDKDDFVRWEAVNMLGQLQDPRATEAVLTVALEDNDVHARWRAIWAITRFDFKKVKPLLLKALKTGNKTKKWNAAVTLSVFGSKEGEKLLLKGLESPEEWIRWEALSALRSAKILGIESKVAALLHPEQPRSIRQEAILTLGSIESKKAIQEIIKAIKDPETEVRWRISMVLSQYDTPEVKKAVKKWREMEKNPKVIKQLNNDFIHLN